MIDWFHGVNYLRLTLWVPMSCGFPIVNLALITDFIFTLRQISKQLLHRFNYHSSRDLLVLFTGDAMCIQRVHMVDDLLINIHFCQRDMIGLLIWIFFNGKCTVTLLQYLSYQSDNTVFFPKWSKAGWQFVLLIPILVSILIL